MENDSINIAVCLYGLTGEYLSLNGDQHPIKPRLSYENYMNVLFKEFNSVDFFVHSWSGDREDEIIGLYKPKKYLFEEQKDFSNFKITDYSLEYINTYKKLFTTESDVGEFLKKYIFNSHSRWYSTCKSLNLMGEYSKELKIQYDWVLQLRFDLFFREPIPFLTLDRSKFYTCPRFHMDQDVAINDTWFLSNQKDAIKFSSLYSKIRNYSIWTHSAAKQHLDNEGILLGEYPDRVIGKKNYWMMREVLKEEEYLNNLTLINNLKIKILGRLSWFNKTLISIFERFQNTLDNCLKKISPYY